MDLLLKVLTVAIVLLGFYADFTQGRLRRCYVCRSRGELGDCKDPFEYNATIVENLRAVEAVPCASGWCAKIIEGDKNADFDTATERMCVQRPPQDGEERCSDTIIDRKPVYMCFCHGDLCNASTRIYSASYLMLVTIGTLILIFGKWISA